jgi:two-component system chemotaxis sensor kinase CheA
VTEDLFSPDEMFQMYVEEGHEHVQLLNFSLLAVERDGPDEVSINEAFRAAHSIKGLAATMGFEATTRLTHELEETLARVRNDPAQVTGDSITVLLQS